MNGDRILDTLAADNTRLKADKVALVEALADLMRHEPDHSDTLWQNARAAIEARGRGEGA